MYLNYFDFLHNAVGIKTAADVYLTRILKSYIDRVCHAYWLM